MSPPPLPLTNAPSDTADGAFFVWASDKTTGDKTNKLDMTFSHTMNDRWRADRMVRW